MTPKGFLGFSIVTLIVIVAAAFSVASRYGATTSGESTARVFPALADKVNEVTEIVYQDAEQTLTIKRDGQQWVIVERGGYVADSETVRDFLVGLSELREGEPKTRMEERYPRIGVEDVDAEGANSKLYRIKGPGGDELAALIVGRDTVEVAGISGVGRYVRRLGEDRAWLAKGRLGSPDTVKALVDPRIMHVATERMARVTVVQADGKVMEIEKPEPKGRKFKIADLAPDATVKYPNDVDNVGDGLDRLELEDVRPEGEIEFPADKTVNTEYRTHDGLVVEVRTFEEDVNTFWATFKARAADGIEDEEKAKKAKEEADKINADVGGWVFRIPAYKYRYMSRRLEEVLEEDKGAG